MTKVHTLKQGRDNFCYVIELDNKEAIVVDVPDAKATKEFLEHAGLSLHCILVTHGHSDHVDGLPEIAPELFYAPYELAEKFGAKKVEAGSKFSVAGVEFEVFHVPGHAPEHVCYYCSELSALFVGDVLFDAGCGRLFSGTAADFYPPLMEMLSVMPEDTKLYIGHDYSKASLEFAKSVEPGNALIAAREDELSELNSPVLLSDQYKINPFLRASSTEIRKYLGVEDASDQDVFSELRKRKDNF